MLCLAGPARLAQHWDSKSAQPWHTVTAGRGTGASRVGLETRAVVTTQARL